MDKHVRLELKTEVKELNKVVGFVENICDQHNIYNNYFGNIVTAVSEAFLNAVEHGNKKDISKNISLDFEVINDGFTFCISDQGLGFDTNSIIDPTELNLDKEIQGKGIFLMKSLSDGLEFRDNGAQVCLKFKISSINKEMADARVVKLKSFIKSTITQNSLN